MKITPDDLKAAYLSVRGKKAQLSELPPEGDTTKAVVRSVLDAILGAESVTSVATEAAVAIRRGRGRVRSVTGTKAAAATL